MKLQHSPVAARATPAILKDRSDTITIATYALTGTFVIFFVARQIMKAIVFRKLASDDLFIMLATVFAIVLSVITLMLASEGFGDSGLLTIERANTIMKGYYASELLYISTLCFSKLSIIVLFYNVVVLRTHRFFVLGFGVFIFAWSVASVVATAFQCGLPRPWEMMTLRCFNTRIYWIVYCVVDMSTEIFIIMLSVDLVAHLRVRISRKFAVVACFAPRLLVVAAALFRAVYLYQVTPHRNPEYNLWVPTICTQTHVCVSICTACIPYMVPFFKTLQGNIWRSYSIRSWTARSRPVHLSGSSPNRLRKREASIRFESPKPFTSLIKEPERVSIVSPRIPSPGPISPFMPPPLSMLRVPKISTLVTESRDSRGLSVSGTLYDSESDQMFDMISLQTAISSSPSPIEPPTHARLSSAANIDTPEPFEYPALLGSPDPSSSGSSYTSRASTPTGVGTSQRFSIFPQDAQQYTPMLPVPQRALTPAQAFQHQQFVADDETTHLLFRQTLPNPAVAHTFEDFVHPARSASSKSHPKFSTTPRLHASPPTAVPSHKV